MGSNEHHDIKLLSRWCWHHLYVFKKDFTTVMFQLSWGTRLGAEMVLKLAHYDYR